MKKLIFLILLILSDNAYSQSLLTLEAYSRRVEESNNGLQQAKWQSLAATQTRKVSQAASLPQIDIILEGTANLNHLDAWHAPKGSYHPYTYQALASLTWPIYQGGSIIAQKRMARANETIQKLHIETTLDQLHYQSEVCYWQASSAKALLKAAKAYKAIVIQQQNLVQQRFNEGAIGRTDLLLINTRSKEAQLQLIQAEEYHTLCITRLNILMNQMPNTPIDSLESIDSPLPTFTHVSLKESLPFRADYQSSYFTIRHRQAARKQAMSQYLPQVSLFFASGWDTGTSYMGDDVVHTPIIGVNINIPLVRWGAGIQTNKREKALISIEQLAQDDLLDNITLQHSEATIRLRETSRQVQTAYETMLLADENLRLITFSYNEGRNSMNDVLSAQLSWTTAQSNLIQAHLAQKLAIAEYKRVTSQ